MIVINVTELSTGKLIPAEVRQYVDKTKMMVLIKDFSTSKMNSVIFNWNTDKWVSTDSTFETDYIMPKVAPVTVRVPKKKSA